MPFPWVCPCRRNGTPIIAIEIMRQGLEHQISAAGLYRVKISRALALSLLTATCFWIDNLEAENGGYGYWTEADISTARVMEIAATDWPSLCVDGETRRLCEVRLKMEMIDFGLGLLSAGIPGCTMDGRRLRELDVSIEMMEAGQMSRNKVLRISNLADETLLETLRKNC